MPLYTVDYHDRTTRWSSKRQHAFAVNENELRANFRVSGKRVIKSKPLGNINKIYRFKIKADQLLGYIDQLMMMIGAGKSINEAAQRIARQNGPYNLRLMSSVIAERLTVFGVGEAFATFPNIFPTHVAGILEAGAKAGKLEELLRQIREYMRDNQKLSSAVNKGTVYPKVVSGIMLIVCGVAFGYIVPNFVKVFKEFKVKMPSITQNLFDISSFVQHNAIAIVGGLVGTFVLWQTIKRRYAVRFFIDRMMIKTPFVGTCMQYVAASRLCGTLGVLVHAGVNAQDALATCAKVVGNTVHEAAIKEAHTSLGTGRLKIAGALQRTGYFPDVMIASLEVAEETGKIPASCAKLHEYYSTEAKTKIDTAVDALGPVLIVIMVSVGGYIVAGLFLPIFSLASGVSGAK